MPFFVNQAFSIQLVRREGGITICENVLYNNIIILKYLIQEYFSSTKRENWFRNYLRNFLIGPSN